MADTSQKFSCPGCGRSLPWRKEIAGKMGKCSCGKTITVPSQPESENADLYDLSEAAELAEKAVAKLPPTVVAAAPAAAMPAPRAAAKVYPNAAPGRQMNVPPAGGRISPTAIRALVMAIVGIVLTAVCSSSMLPHDSPLIVTVAPYLLALLVSLPVTWLALAVEGWFSISFGGFVDSLPKFIAIILFCGGVGSVGSVAVLTFARGSVGFSGMLDSLLLGIVVGIAIAVAAFWSGFCILFGFKPDECGWAAVVITIIYGVSKVVMGLVLGIMLGVGLLMHYTATNPMFRNATTNPAEFGQQLSQFANTMVDKSIDDARKGGRLEDARTSDMRAGRPDSEANAIALFYSEGALNVWYEAAAIGKREPISIVVELPADPASRAKCFDTANAWFRDTVDPKTAAAFNDSGDRYIVLFLPLARTPQ